MQKHINVKSIANKLRHYEETRKQFIIHQYTKKKKYGHAISKPKNRDAKTEEPVSRTIF